MKNSNLPENKTLSELITELIKNTNILTNNTKERLTNEEFDAYKKHEEITKEINRRERLYLLYQEQQLYRNE